MPNWIDSQVRAFEFFQGVTKLLVPDKSAHRKLRICHKLSVSAAETALPSVSAAGAMAAITAEAVASAATEAARPAAETASATARLRRWRVARSCKHCIICGMILAGLTLIGVAARRRRGAVTPARLTDCEAGSAMPQG